MKSPLGSTIFSLVSAAAILSLSPQIPSFAQNTSKAGAKPTMKSRVFQWADMKGQPSETATYRNVFDAPTATLEALGCHVTTLNPGKEPHPPHKHVEEELIIIKEGALEVMQNGVTNNVSAGGMIFCASNEFHGWRNATTNPATYYVLKIVPHDLPKQTSPTNSGARPKP
jgi:hypothetical protein